MNNEKLKNTLSDGRAYANKHNQIVFKNLTIKEKFNYMFYQFIGFNLIYNQYVKFVLLIIILIVYKLVIKYHFQIDIVNTSFAEEDNNNVVNQQYAVKLTWTQIFMII